MIEVKKVFQSPCTPAVDVEYLVKISHPIDLADVSEFEKQLIKDLEKIYTDRIFGSLFQW